jgi:hypothetical protein
VARHRLGAQPLTEDAFDETVRAAHETPVEGWDFGVFAGRYEEDDPPWDYRRLVRAHLDGAGSLLDLGTGGGELLAELAPLPEHTVATEGHPPNVPIARRRLGPLGVEVVEVEEGGRLPLPDAAFDLVIDRHEEGRRRRGAPRRGGVPSGPVPRCRRDRPVPPHHAVAGPRLHVGALRDRAPQPPTPSRRGRTARGHMPPLLRNGAPSAVTGAG